ncbi:hypothetical protein TRFO_05877 [Tritrichomonas foetus]|uniref:Uncharacterized protein n=1 Tax=Tritrichomonas foetus TaxID=1144522 RepID=A0A1J4K3F8_9EUKA|nr:hypothetical protein TRFO_05877 [Tritrichomonas foetus]|eukprot:OHT05715.1 hypothetical protein TRFO_05877 [Tritrichomonas foetus]
MYTSLHLSDLSDDSVINPTIVPPLHHGKTLYSSFGGLQSTFFDIQTKTSKIKQFSSQIQRYERRLREEKRRSESEKKKSLYAFDSEVKQLDQRYIDLQQIEKNLLNKRKAVENSISEQKVKLLEIESEFRRITKNNEWANITFAMKENESPISNSILQVKSDLEDVNLKIKNTRHKIFHYQKEILRIAENMTPIKSQNHLLKAKIDEIQADQIDKNYLQYETQKAIACTIERQRLSYTRSTIEKSINKILDRIIVLKDEKNRTIEKLLNMKAIINDTVVDSIHEQILQYKEATLRKRKLYDERKNSSHISISYELELKIELDSIREDLSIVNKQWQKVAKILNARNYEVNKLEKKLDLNNEFIYFDKEDKKLEALISQIHEKRIEYAKLSKMKPKEVDYRLNEDEIKSIKEKMLLDEIQMKSELSDTKIEICELHSQINELNQHIQKKLRRKHHSKSSISSFGSNYSHFNDKEKEKSNLTITENSKYHEKEEEEEEGFEEDENMVITPKIILLKENIRDIEHEIEIASIKKEKRVQKLQEKREQINSYLSQLDEYNVRPIIIRDLFDKYDRSLDWLINATFSQLKFWRKLLMPSPQILNDWNIKTLSPSYNEAEGISMKFSLYR